MPLQYISLLSLLIATTAQAANTDCQVVSDLRAGNTTDLTQNNFACLLSQVEAVRAENKQLMGKVGELEKDNSNLRQRVGEFSTGLPMPSGIVAAFDLPNGCPKGWAIFEPAISRVIVGAVGPSRSMQVPTSDMHGSRLSARQYRSDGGEESHVLMLDQLPQHSHSFRLGTATAPAQNEFDQRFMRASNSARGGNTLTGGAGPGDNLQGKPHANMQPYVAL
jgi:hypothetical protein